MKIKQCILIGEPFKTNSSNGNYAVKRQSTVEHTNGEERTFEDNMFFFRKIDAHNVIEVYKDNGMYKAK